jgi:hypothetical protein
MMRFALALIILRLFRFSVRSSPAYLDPGSGAMILQILLGGVAGVAVLFRLFWHRIAGVLRLGRGNSDEEHTDNS